MRSLPSNQSPIALPRSDNLIHLSYKPVFAEHPNLVHLVLEKFPNLRTLNTQKIDESIRKKSQYINSYVSPLLAPVVFALEEIESRARKDFFRVSVKLELKLLFEGDFQPEDKIEGTDHQYGFKRESETMHGLMV